MALSSYKVAVGCCVRIGIPNFNSDFAACDLPVRQPERSQVVRLHDTHESNANRPASILGIKNLERAVMHTVATGIDVDSTLLAIATASAINDYHVLNRMVKKLIHK